MTRAWNASDDASAVRNYTRATNDAHAAYIAATAMAWERYRRATAEAWSRYLAQAPDPTAGNAPGAQPPPSPGQAPASSVRESQGAASGRPAPPPNPEQREYIGLPGGEWSAAMEMLAAAADGPALAATFTAVWRQCRHLLTEDQRDALLRFHQALQAFHGGAAGRSAG